MYDKECVMKSVWWRVCDEGCDKECDEECVEEYDEECDEGCDEEDCDEGCEWWRVWVKKSVSEEECEWRRVEHNLEQSFWIFLLKCSRRHADSDPERWQERGIRRSI